MKSYGQTAYDAYYKFSVGNTPIPVAPSGSLPAWEDQSQELRDAWCKAGEAVAEQARKDVG